MGKEKEIVLEIVVESLRLASLGCMFCLLVLGVILTFAWGGIEPNNPIEINFGFRHLCLFLDYRPIPYVSPPLYTVVLLLGIFYHSASVFRIWIAYSEGKIPNGKRIFLQICHLINASCSIMFILAFAIQPTNAETLIVHTLPFCMFEIGMVFGQVAVLLFGMSVAWKTTQDGLPIPGWFVKASIAQVVINILFTLLNVLIQLNNVLVPGKRGVAIDVTPNGWFVYFSFAIDSLWTFSAFLVPIFQSIYLTKKGGKTHTLIVTLCDNRTALKSSDSKSD